ncbi:MAG: ComEC/Rec2 family competence protein [Peptostreptococcaceae bacterium]|jgi:competence protein ComEC|nr:ComEC/Rec2 family competence protein [Peptostreptococcaceae bacterium]
MRRKIIYIFFCLLIVDLVLINGEMKLKDFRKKILEKEFFIEKIEKNNFSNNVFFENYILRTKLDLNEGDRIYLKGVLKKLSLKKDYDRYLISKNIDYEVKLVSIKILDKKMNIYKIRRGILQKIKKSIDKNFENKEFIKALILSNKNEFSKDILNEFSKIGIIHYMVASGFHMGILILFLDKLLFFVDRKYKFLIILIISYIYSFLLYFSYPILRCFYFLLIYYIAYLFKLRFDFISTIFFVMSIEILRNNYCVYNLSFLYSYFCILGMALMYRYIKNILKLNLLSLSISIFLFIFPLSIFYFKSLSFIVFISNIFFSPIFLVLYISSILAIVIDFIFSLNFNIFAIFSDSIINSIYFFKDILINLNFLYFENLNYISYNIFYYYILIICIYIVLEIIEIKETKNGVQKV